MSFQKEPEVRVKSEPPGSFFFFREKYTPLSEGECMLHSFKKGGVKYALVPT